MDDGSGTGELRRCTSFEISREASFYEGKPKSPLLAREKWGTHEYRLSLTTRSLTRIPIGSVWRGFGLAQFEFVLAEFCRLGGIGPRGYRGFLEEVAPAFMVVAGTLRFLESLQCGFRLLLPANDRDHPRRPVGSDVVQDDGVRSVVVVACQKKSICDGVSRLSPANCVQKRRGDLRGYRLSAEFVGLNSLNVFGLQALGALGDTELHRLALLQALESARLDGRKMHENVFARLAADKAVALGVIEPLHCSLFHVFCTLVSFLIVTLEGFGGTCAGYWLLRRELLKTDSV